MVRGAEAVESDIIIWREDRLREKFEAAQKQGVDRQRARLTRKQPGVERLP